MTRPAKSKKKIMVSKRKNCEVGFRDNTIPDRGPRQVRAGGNDGTKEPRPVRHMRPREKAKKGKERQGHQRARVDTRLNSEGRYAILGENPNLG